MAADWRFLLKPTWLISHVFVGALVLSFIWAGFWQLSRLSEVKERNATIESRASMAPIRVGDLASVPSDEVDFRPVADTGHYAQTELIRVANRSYNGLAGDWIVAHFVTDSGEDVLVNRGFLGRDQQAAAPLDDGSIVGWFRNSEVKDGIFAATDTGEGERVPRLDVAVLSARFDIDAVDAWVQLAPVETEPDELGATTFLPNALELPPLSNGNHLSYAVQWFVFAVLGSGAYVLVLRKLVRQRTLRGASNEINTASDN